MIDVRYDDIFTFSNLYKAYEKCCKGRKYKASKIRFEKDISNNLIRLYENLRKRTYRMTSYHTYTIYEPKERNIHCIDFKDYSARRVQNCTKVVM